MPRFSYRSPQAVLAGLMLLASSAAAQAAPPPSPPVSIVPVPTTPQAAPAVPQNAPAAPQSAPAAPAVPQNAPAVSPASPAVVAPQVTALFGQTIAAHQALTALYATITRASTGSAAGANSTQTIKLAYKKPGYAKIKVSGAAGPAAEFYSDGKTLTQYIVQTKQYGIQPVPAGVQTIPLILNQARALLPRLIGTPAALNELLAQPGITASVNSQSSVPPASVGGVAVDTVIVLLPAPDGSKATFTFDIGKADHLLRRLTESANLTNNGTPQTLTVTETVSNLHANPALTAASFHFAPPPGVTKIKAAAQQAQPPMHDPRLAPGAKPFPVTARDLQGHPLSLAQYNGKVVLMDFWATWCGPCVGEMPNVIAAYNKYHAQGFDVVGISLDQSRPALTAFIAQNKMPWRQVFDGAGWGSAVPREYGVQAIPFGLLIGRDGQIAAVDVRGPELMAAIQKALAK